MQGKEDMDLLRVIYHYSRVAYVIYGWGMMFMTNPGRVMQARAASDMDLFLRHCNVSKEDIVKLAMVAEVGRPAYILFIDRMLHRLVLAIRGSLSVSDGLTDLLCDTTPITVGRLHAHTSHPPRPRSPLSLVLTA